MEPPGRGASGSDARKIGRNEPCPCGSGLKHKKCCLLGAGAPSGAWTPAERQSALVALGRFGWRHEFDADRAHATARFWPDALEILPETERRGVIEQGEAHFQDWYTTDVRLASGETLIDLFLEREGRRLRTGERRYLERARATQLRPYEVVAVRPEEGFDLLDLWVRKRIRVQERLATRQVVQWDVLVARLMLGPAGVPVLDGPPYLFPARARDDLLKDLRSLRRRFHRRGGTSDDVDFFKRFGSAYFAWWLLHVVVAARPPQLRSAEGDELVIARTVFDVRDRAALDRALSGHPDLHRQDDASYAWFEVGGDETLRRTLGTFRLDEGRVVLETMSRPRAERGRAFLESLAGDAVRHRATTLEGVEQAMRRLPPAPSPEPAEVPPEVEAAVVGAYYEKHYRVWVDEPLPALGGQTPREAARSKSRRPRVLALLKEMESMAARQRLAGRPAHDFGWMWAELGLDRPG